MSRTASITATLLNRLLRTRSSPPTSRKALTPLSNKDEGAGDQGIMFGYATKETPELMPAPIHYAHKILAALADERHSGREPRLGPDAKSQVTVEYRGGAPVRAHTIVLSTQHLDENMSSGDVRARSDMKIQGDVTWYASSDRAKRGFCGTCGSNLFWDGGGQNISIFAGHSGRRPGPKDRWSHLLRSTKGPTMTSMKMSQRPRATTLI